MLFDDSTIPKNTFDFSQSAPTISDIMGNLNKPNVNNNQMVGNFDTSPLPEVKVKSNAVELNPLEQRRFRGMSVSTDNPYRAMANQYLSKTQRETLRAQAQEWENQNSATRQKQLGEETNRGQKSALLMGLLSNAASNPEMSQKLGGLVNALSGSFKGEDLADVFSSAGNENLTNQLTNTILQAFTSPSKGTFSYDPSQYAGRFSNQNPWAPYLDNPNNFSSQKDVADAYENAVKWEKDQKPGSSNESNANLNRLYQGVLDSYSQYQSNIINRREKDVGTTPGTTPLSLERWLRQPGREGLLNIYNQFTSGGLRSLPSPYSTKTPEELATAKQKKAQSKMVSYRPNEDYNQDVWDQTNNDVARFGGPGAALTYYLKNGNTTPQRLVALLDRYNQYLKARGSKKQYTQNNHCLFHFQ